MRAGFRARQRLCASRDVPDAEAFALRGSPLRLRWRLKIGAGGLVSLALYRAAGVDRDAFGIDGFTCVDEVDVAYPVSFAEPHRDHSPRDEWRGGVPTTCPPSDRCRDWLGIIVATDATLG